jgi:hypothetical protein
VSSVILRAGGDSVESVKATTGGASVGGMSMAGEQAVALAVTREATFIAVL